MNPLLPLEYCSDVLHVFSTVFLFIRWIRRCPIGHLVAQANQGMGAAKVIELLLHR